MKYLFIQKVTSTSFKVLAILLMLTSSCDIFESSSSQKNTEIEEEGWSEPEILFTLRVQNSVDDSLSQAFNMLQATVQQETIHLVTNNVRRINHRILDFSEILFLQKEEGGTTEIRQITKRDLPSEQPTILRDHEGNLHLLWGDRRLDPNFEQWESTSMSQTANFSTNVVYTRYDGTGFEPPVSIYEGNLSLLGRGDIQFPLQLVEAADHRLHTVFKADSLVRTTNTMGDSVTAFDRRFVYMNRPPAGVWSEPRFLFIDYEGFPEGHSLTGTNPVIAAPSANRLVVAFLSSVGGVNDVLAITSDDGGRTWSEAQLVFSSGRQASFFLKMRQAPGGRLHLVWAKLVDDVLPEEMWHSYSEDAGNNWSQPERFFTLRKPTFIPTGSPEPPETIISSYDIVVDENNRVHWAGIEVVFVDSLHNKIHYTSWDPGTKTWEESSLFEFAEDPPGVELAVDRISERLYLFWRDDHGKTIKYSAKSVR